MIVDCHTHIDSAGDRYDSSLLLSAGTVDISIVLAKGPDRQQANRRLAEYVEKNKGRLVGLAVIDPIEDDISVRGISAVVTRAGLSGIVLYCCEMGFHPAHSRAMQLYETASGLNLPVFFHNSCDLSAGSVMNFAQPYLVDEVALEFPELRIVIGNMGGPFIDQSLALARKCKNVYLDLTIKPQNSWSVYNMVISAYEASVMDKLLFGSGAEPDKDAGECIETLLGFNKLFGDTGLAAVPRGQIRKVIERDTLSVLGISK